MIKPYSYCHTEWRLLLLKLLLSEVLLYHTECRLLLIKNLLSHHTEWRLLYFKGRDGNGIRRMTYALQYCVAVYAAVDTPEMAAGAV